MKSALLFLALFLSLILESTVLSLPGIRAYAPNLILDGVIMVGLLRTPSLALAFGFSIGFIEDASYSGFLGETAFAYALAGYLAGYVRGLVMRESLLLAMLLAGLGEELFNWVTFGAGRLFGSVDWSLHTMLLFSSRTSLTTMLCMILVYPLYRKAFKLRQPASYRGDRAGRS